MNDIFISYSSKDLNRAKIFAEIFESNGFRVWLDRNIPTGMSYDKVIEEALSNSKCVIVLWSKNSVESSWVFNEANEAREKGILIPILIDNVNIPLAFRNIQTADFSSGKENEQEAISSLLLDINRIVSKSKLNNDISTLEPSNNPDPNSSNLTNNKSKDKYTGRFQKKKSKSWRNYQLIGNLIIAILIVFPVIEYFKLLKYNAEYYETERGQYIFNIISLILIAFIFNYWIYRRRKKS